MLTLSVWSIFVDSREVRLGFGGFKVSDRRQHGASGVKSHEETVNGPRWKKMQMKACEDFHPANRTMGVVSTQETLRVCSRHALKFHQSWLISVCIMHSYNVKIDLLKQEYQCCGHSLSAKSLSTMRSTSANLWPKHQSKEVGRWMNGLSELGSQSVILYTNPQKWADGWMASDLGSSSVGCSTNLRVWGHFDQVSAVSLSMCTDRRQWSQFLEPLSDHWHLGCVTTHQSGSHHTSPSLLWRLSTYKLTGQYFGDL